MGRCTVVVFMLLFVCNMYGQQRFLSNHPRLLFTGAEEAAVKQLIQNNQLAGELAEFLKAKADTLAITPQKPYLKDKYGNILWTSRSYVNRLGTLALAYRLYGERKYLDAANEALLWVCNYPDWDPPHYLDTAEMATAVAIAYDWLYDALPISTKDLVKKCLYERAIVRVLREYERVAWEVGRNEKPIGTWYVTLVWCWPLWVLQKIIRKRPLSFLIMLPSICPTA